MTEWIAAGHIGRSPHEPESMTESKNSSTFFLFASSNCVMSVSAWIMEESRIYAHQRKHAVPTDMEWISSRIDERRITGHTVLSSIPFLFRSLLFGMLWRPPSPLQPYTHLLCRCISYEIGARYVGTRVDKFIRDKYPRVLQGAGFQS